jgi:UDP-N-acetyl-2-amino-2-deoxyglucuronate dehydrogenase
VSENSSAPQRYSIALVGCGRISERHLDAIARQPALRLVAVSDEVEERARAAGEKWGVPWFTS